jgi:hypothetical protein
MDTQIEASATATTSRPIGIKTTYIVFDGDDGTTTTTSETFDASRNDASEARVGLPVGVEPAKVRCETCRVMNAIFGTVLLLVCKLFVPRNDPIVENA